MLDFKIAVVQDKDCTQAPAFETLINAATFSECQQPCSQYFSQTECFSYTYGAGLSL